MALSTVNAAALAALEGAVAQALSLDPSAVEELARLRGKVLHLHCRIPAFDVFLLPGTNGLRLQAVHEGDSDCRICGNASEYLQVLSAEDPASALINGGLEVHGDTAALLQLRDTLARLDLDWEGRLSSYVGDIPAHQLGRAMRGSAKWGRRSASTLLRHVEEFVHEEARLAPSREEVEDFFSDLQTLDLRLQRLEARLRRQMRRANRLED